MAPRLEPGQAPAGENMSDSSPIEDPHPWKTILVAAMGFAIDAYDAVLFPILRTESFRDLGLVGAASAQAGVAVLGAQFAGMCAGSLVFGIGADKLGRVRALWLSIFLYSAATFLNGCVSSLSAYTCMRFLAGVGLAGELGIAITLATELLPRAGRSLGSLIVGLLGASGGIVSALLNQHLPWRVAYVLGGCMGIVLLVLRLRLHEPRVYREQASTSNYRGNLLDVIRSPSLLLSTIGWVLVGAPLTVVMSYFVTLAPEYSAALNLSSIVTPAWALVSVYSGLAAGELCLSLICEYQGGRRKPLILTALIIIWAIPFALHMLRIASVTAYCLTGFSIGFCLGYWTLYLTAVSESFPTRMRATMTTVIVNLTRVTIYPYGALYAWFGQHLVAPMGFFMTFSVSIGSATLGMLFMKEHCDASLAAPAAGFFKAKPQRQAA